jgi:hypothetical protein
MQSSFRLRRPPTVRHRRGSQGPGRRIPDAPPEDPGAEQLGSVELANQCSRFRASHPRSASTSRLS